MMFKYKKNDLYSIRKKWCVKKRGEGFVVFSAEDFEGYIQSEKRFVTVPKNKILSVSGFKNGMYSVSQDGNPGVLLISQDDLNFYTFPVTFDIIQKTFFLFIPIRRFIECDFTFMSKKDHCMLMSPIYRMYKRCSEDVFSFYMPDMLDALNKLYMTLKKDKRQSHIKDTVVYLEKMYEKASNESYKKQIKQTTTRQKIKELKLYPYEECLYSPEDGAKFSDYLKQKTKAIN